MKNVKVPIVLVLAMFIFVSTAQARPNANAGIEKRAMLAVAMMYAPTPQYHSYWLDAVCDQMTEGGCRYFTDNLESLFWQKGQIVTGDSAHLVGVAATLDDGSQVWKATVTAYKKCGVVFLKNCPFLESDIYLHVVYDETQRAWLLNRVLYGPYIDLPQFEDQ